MRKKVLGYAILDAEANTCYKQYPEHMASPHLARKGMKIDAPMIRDTIKTQLAQVRASVGEERYDKTSSPRQPSFSSACWSVRSARTFSRSKRTGICR
jgi:hypothetical protein